ncbi:MAG: flagellar basal body-associated FliL family protein [Pirellulales bacterium]|nr:flagellar basal body-associated FliL family protein [Pirellulales bacterium]
MSNAAHDAKAEAPAAAGKPGIMGQLKVGGIIAGIVLMQCGLAYFLLPAAPTAAATEQKTDAEHGSGEHAAEGHGDSHGDEHGHGHDAHGGHKAETREVDLGKYSITSFDQSTNSTILIDFHLYGTVEAEPETKKDEAADAHGGGHGGHGGGHGAPASKPGAEPEDDSKFGKLLKKHKHRFRDTVIVTIRNSSSVDLSDPALGLIKRQILAKTNSLLGEPLLKEMIFSDFSVVQQ